MVDAVQAAPYSGLTQTATQTQPTKVNNSKTLGQEAFLKLLTVQMANQDPLDPMSNEEFITQMAQLQTLEQTIAMTKTFENFGRNQELGAASALIGKTVKAVIPANGEQEAEDVTGPVTSVRLSDGEVKLVVNGKEVALDNILEVTNPTTNNNTNSPDNGASGGDVVDFFLPSA